ncbi:MAG: hypothetical protein JWN14_3249, partial [Chthonomonadales bacterium]|nr:hypothetical protein [Chthonomonadales bacterium]
NCPRVNRNGKPAGWLHSLACPECREAKRTDDLLAFGIVQLRTQANAHSALNRTLTALALPTVEENYRRRLQLRSRNRTRIATGAAVFLCVASWFGYMDWTPAAIPLPPSMEASPAYIALMHAAPVQSSDSRQATKIHTISKIVRKMNTEHDPVSDQEKEAVHHFIVDNAASMATVRANLLKPYQESMDNSAQTINDNYLPLYSILMTLQADAVWRATQGDRSGAIDAALNMIAFGENIVGGGSWRARYYGLEMQEDGRRHLWRFLPEMSEEEARQASLRMEKAMKRHTSVLSTAQWEHDANLRIKHEMFGVPFWRIRDANQFASPTMYPGETLSQLYVTYTLYTRSNRTLLKELNEAQRASEQQFEYPYAPNRGAVGVYQDPIAQKLRPDENNNFKRARFQDMESETQNALLTTALAIRAYHQEYGVDPVTLNSLCPQYLEKVPADPFHPQAPLQYAALKSKFHSFVSGSVVGRVGSELFVGHGPAKPTKVLSESSSVGPGASLGGQIFTLHYVLYSVGPDGFDQHGAFIDHLPSAGGGSTIRDRFRILEESQGDIVAGINL